MTYARARLWLGISGVGAQVVLASAALWLHLPHRFLYGRGNLAAIVLTLTFYVGISLPSDLLGGYILPRLHGRTKLSRNAYLAGWLRGVLSQAFVMGLCAMAIIYTANLGGTWAGIVCLAVLMLTLLAAQSIVAQLVGGFRVTRGALDDASSQFAVAIQSPASASGSTFIFESTDTGFVGGVIGLPGHERLVLPSAWLDSLPAETLFIERLRRKGVIITGARTRGLAVGFTWNLLGWSLACYLPGSSLTGASGLVQCGLWFTLWSFLGLLLLPSINRPGVIEADRFAVAQGVSAHALATAIFSLDRLQDDEPARTRWVERIFHPIPSVENRVAALRDVRSPRGAWQSARIALYLSWACFGFLSRAVHCNAGRPELWVLFPGD